METIYRIKQRAETIVENTRLNDVTFGGWKAVNIGTGVVEVFGVPLQPGEGLDYMNCMRPGDLWQEPIDIAVQPGGALRLLRLICTEITK